MRFLAMAIFLMGVAIISLIVSAVGVLTPSVLRVERTSCLVVNVTESAECLMITAIYRPNYGANSSDYNNRAFYHYESVSQRKNILAGLVPNKTELTCWVDKKDKYYAPLHSYYLYPGEMLCFMSNLLFLQFTVMLIGAALRFFDNPP